jgi:hypothetical protein
MIAFMAGAQPAEDTKPDFSGTWNQGASRYGPRQSRDAHAGLGSGWGKQFTIIQTEDSLTLERIIFTQGDLQPPLRYVYSLKGSETRNTIMMGRGIQEQVSTTSWEGRKLVIKTIFTSQNPVDGKKISCEVTHTLTLLINESLPYWPFLIVETKRGGVLGGPSSTTRTVYSKN